MSGDSRLPTHLEVSGLIRMVEAAGGFAAVLAKGERDAGSILIICCEPGRPDRLFERMPDMEGGRRWSLSRTQDIENPRDFSEYWMRRRDQDSDLWIVELVIADGERFIASLGT